MEKEWECFQGRSWEGAFVCAEAQPRRERRRATGAPVLGAEWPWVPRAEPGACPPLPQSSPQSWPALIPAAPGLRSRDVCLPNAPEQHEGAQIWARNKWQRSRAAGYLLCLLCNPSGASAFPTASWANKDKKKQPQSWNILFPLLGLPINPVRSWKPTVGASTDRELQRGSAGGRQCRDPITSPQPWKRWAVVQGQWEPVCRHLHASETAAGQTEMLVGFCLLTLCCCMSVSAKATLVAHPHPPAV